LKDLKNYRIGTIIDDVGEQLLEKNGFSKKSFDRVSGLSSILSSIKKLNSGRIDLFSYSPTTFLWKAKSSGFNPDSYELVYTLKKGKYYYAFNKNTPDKIISKLQSNLNSVKKNGIYRKIIIKYLH
jgi:polar amino acid transport system substrate-binding protein